MSRRVTWFVMVLVFAGILPCIHAQIDPNDPLTEDEIQQIRDNKTNPNERIKLYIKFVDDRLSALRQLSAQPKGNNRSAQIRDKLEEFTRLCDELQDNLDMYDEAHADIRKSLKDLKDDAAKWPATLDALPPDQNYEFSQKMAVEAAQSAQDEAKQLAEEQDIFFTAHKNMRNKNGTGPS